jgi:hypothetical protein
MLGINREEKMLTENIIIPTVSLATHAYIISKKGALKILDRIKKNKINNHIDYYLHSIKDLKCISCHPRIVFQTSTDTMKSENVKASHPILLTSLLNKVYIDKMVRANYLTCVSFARIGPVDINIISVIFLFIGIILTVSLKKVDVNIMKKVTLFYILLSIPDIYYLNYLETIIFNYILLITPLLTRSFLS